MVGDVVKVPAEAGGLAVSERLRGDWATATIPARAMQVTAAPNTASHGESFGVVPRLSNLRRAEFCMAGLQAVIANAARRHAG